ncbi:hypothetical protein N7463_004753 [Penicillium fimorum]|uniref:Uncharacterized protein n=1 Tax=Penicillium fimorum TaxID=1882269 RepID=A0A9W9XR94_9EURO|nr:hypothetical protein N7463_004753 [Penicillium fimorum]
MLSVGSSRETHGVSLTRSRPSQTINARLRDRSGETLLGSLPTPMHGTRPPRLVDLAMMGIVANPECPSQADTW